MPSDSQQPLPPRLCRYRSFTAGKESRVYDLLQGRLWFADIYSFNDPFEARPVYEPAYADAATQRKAVIEYLATLAVALFPNSRTQRRRWAEERIQGKSMEDLANSFEGLDRGGRYFVLCLMAEETVSTPLPWSHYADEHRGVCIHFDTSRPPVSLAFPVIYSEEYPRIVFPRTALPTSELVENLLFRKSTCWSYEREYRVARLRDGTGSSGDLRVRWSSDETTALAPPDITHAVTIGCRMDKALRAALCGWIKTNTPHVEVWQASLHRSRYEVIRERIQ